MTASASDALSLSEFEALCLLALRGARCPWGIAEDIAKLSRWLAANGFEAAQCIVDCLPTDDAPCCCARDDPPCAFRQITLLCDRGKFIADGMSWTSAHPLPAALILAAASRIAKQHAVAISLRAGECEAVVDGDGRHDHEAARRLVEAKDRVTLERHISGHTTTEHGTRPLNRPAISDDARAKLEALAAKTRVPATNASRLSGAGAGLNDND